MEAERRNGGPVTIRSMVEEDIPRVREIDVLSFSMPWSERSYRFELNENRNSSIWVAVDPTGGSVDPTGGSVDPTSGSVDPQGRSVDPAAGSNHLPLVIGMIVVWVILDEAHIATIAVDPRYRGHKIGQHLLARGLLEAYQRGARLAYLEVRRSNTAAQRMYEKFGFEVVGVRPHYYKDNNEDALLMTLEAVQPEQLQAYLS